MDRDVFDRETLLDLTVNVIPLGIILFFVLLFLVVAPWGYTPVDTAIQMALLVAPFAALALLTYYSGKAISRDEKKLEAETDADAELEVGASPALQGNETADGASGEDGPENADEASGETDADAADEPPEPETNEALEDG